jgi:hypothetical protein
MRKAILDWLLSPTAFRAWIQIAGAVGIGILYRHIAHFGGVEFAIWRCLLGLTLIFSITGPVYYFFLPPLFFVVAFVLIRFGKEEAEYPCPRVRL